MLAIGCCLLLLGQIVSVIRLALNGNCSLNGQMGELAAMAGAMNVANCGMQQIIIALKIYVFLVLAFYNIKKHAGQVAEKDAELTGFEAVLKNKKEVYGGWY